MPLVEGPMPHRTFAPFWDYTLIFKVPLLEREFWHFPATVTKPSLTALVAHDMSVYALSD